MNACVSGAAMRAVGHAHLPVFIPEQDAINLLSGLLIASIIALGLPSLQIRDQQLQPETQTLRNKQQPDPNR